MGVKMETLSKLFLELAQVVPDRTHRESKANEILVSILLAGKISYKNHKKITEWVADYDLFKS